MQPALDNPTGRILGYLAQVVFKPLITFEVAPEYFSPFSGLTLRSSASARKVALWVSAERVYHRSTR